jgi:hypothetical protein
MNKKYENLGHILQLGCLICVAIFLIGIAIKQHGIMKAQDNILKEQDVRIEKLVAHRTQDNKPKELNKEEKKVVETRIAFDREVLLRADNLSQEEIKLRENILFANQQDDKSIQKILNTVLCSKDGSLIDMGVKYHIALYYTELNDYTFEQLTLIKCDYMQIRDMWEL